MKKHLNYAHVGLFRVVAFLAIAALVITSLVGSAVLIVAYGWWAAAPLLVLGLLTVAYYVGKDYVEDDF